LLTIDEADGLSSVHACSTIHDGSSGGVCENRGLSRLGHFDAVSIRGSTLAHQRQALFP
jgi:hypothetical protein